MARPASKEPTEVELGILNVLWESGPSGLGAICKSIRQARPVAKTTVATMLNVMLEKGLVKRTRADRGYLWSARISRRKAASGLLRRVLDSVFEGSAQRLVAHLLEDETLSEKDRAEIQKLLGISKRQSKRNKGSRS